MRRLPPLDADGLTTHFYSAADGAAPALELDPDLDDWTAQATRRARPSCCGSSAERGPTARRPVRSTTPRQGSSPIRCGAPLLSGRGAGARASTSPSTCSGGTPAVAQLRPVPDLRRPVLVHRACASSTAARSPPTSPSGCRSSSAERLRQRRGLGRRQRPPRRTADRDPGSTACRLAPVRPNNPRGYFEVVVAGGSPAAPSSSSATR